MRVHMLRPMLALLLTLPLPPEGSATAPPRYDAHDFLSTAPGYAMAEDCDDPGSAIAIYRAPDRCASNAWVWQVLKGAYRTDLTAGPDQSPWSSEVLFEAPALVRGREREGAQPFLWLLSEVSLKQASGDVSRYVVFRTRASGRKGYMFLPRYIPPQGMTFPVDDYRHELWYQGAGSRPDASGRCPAPMVVCGGRCAVPSCVPDCALPDVNGGVHYASVSRVLLPRYLVDLRGEAAQAEGCRGESTPSDVEAIRLSYSWGGADRAGTVETEDYYYGRWYDPAANTHVSLGLVRFQYCKSDRTRVLQTVDRTYRYLVKADFGAACLMCPE